MADKHPVDLLMEEHRLIESVLDAFEAELEGMNVSASFPREFISDALDFFGGFADSCHHAKEEDLLFPELERRGMHVNGGPIGCMLHEHEVGRDLLRNIRSLIVPAAAGNPNARVGIYERGLVYVDLLRKHIAKEDNILFRMAKDIIDERSARSMMVSFYDEANERTNAAARQHFKLLAHRLALTSESV